MPVRKYRRETSEVSCCLKYVIFSSNVFFWMVGLGVLAIGLWAWKEKDIFSNLSKTTYILLDPAFILICIGAVIYVIAFTGSVGALRENTCLLATYAIFLSVLLILEVGLGTLAFVFRDKGWIKDQATEGLRAFIIYYREDPDQQNLIDWIQEDWLQCCGIEGPKDWDSNNYFNCSSRAVGSREACGVPFSCCKRKPNEIIKNKQCGYDVRKEGYPAERYIYERGCLRAGEDWLEGHLFPVAGACVSVMVIQAFMNIFGLTALIIFIYMSALLQVTLGVVTGNYDISKIIYEKGCVQAGEEWVERNLIAIASTAIFLVFLEILGICFAQNLRADIFAQKAKWH